MYIYRKSFLQRFWPAAIILAIVIVLCSIGYAKGWMGLRKIEQPTSQPIQLTDNTNKATENKTEPVVPADEVTVDIAPTTPAQPELQPETTKATPPKQTDNIPVPQTSTASQPAAATATPSPAPAPVPPPAPVASSEIQAILDAINAARQQNGLTAVSLNSSLNSAALAKSQDMYNNNYFAHTSPAGVSDITFVNQVGYSYRAVGINLAKGDFGSAQGLVDGWMNSPGHRANILADFGAEIGIGISGQYYTMIIAQPM